MWRSVAICALVAFFGGAWFAGVRIAPVASASMEPTLMQGDTVFMVGSRFKQPAMDDIIIFSTDLSPRTRDVQVIHRLVGVKQDGTLMTKGDGNEKVDTFTVEPARVQAVMVASLPTHLLRNRAVLPLAGMVIAYLLITALWKEESSASPVDQQAQV